MVEVGPSDESRTIEDRIPRWRRTGASDSEVTGEDMLALVRQLRRPTRCWNVSQRRRNASEGKGGRRVEELRSLSPAFRPVLRQLRRFAPVDQAFVLLEGETGTGKNFLARHVHHLSRRNRGPFREANLAAMDDALAGSELFGHVRGAYTDAKQRRIGHFALAHTGTLFLDELGKASRAVQRKLLRVMESAECWPIGAERPMTIDVRLVGATNVPVGQLVETGEFLPDLHARLGSFCIKIPPLRERREDIPALIAQSIDRQSCFVGYVIPPRVSPGLLALLSLYSWPMNVRELEAVVLRLLVDAEGKAELGEELCRGDLAYLAVSAEEGQRLSREQVEREVEIAGTKVGAAARLGVHRSTVYRVLRNDTAAS